MMRQRHEIYDHLFDEEGTPLYISPLGNQISAPMRLTWNEWMGMMCSYAGELLVYLHPYFTMTVDLVPTKSQKYIATTYTDIITIARPYGLPRWVIYGPYERLPYRAEENALKFLTSRGLLQPLDFSPGDVRQRYKQNYEEMKKRQSSEKKLCTTIAS